MAAPGPDSGGAYAGGQGEAGGYRQAWAYQSDERRLGDYLRIAYRRRWLGGTVFTLVVVTAFIFAVTPTPVYQASARLQIERDAPNVVNFEEVITEGARSFRSEFYRTQYEILRSRALARATMDRLGLWDRPDFIDEEQFDPMSAAIRLATSPLRWFSSRRSGAGTGAPSETRVESAAINRFMSKLDVVPVRDSRIVDVRFESTVPALTAEVANTLAQEYIDQDLEFRQASSRDASAWLEQRIGEQRELVEASQLALQRYREEQGTVSPNDRQSIMAQELADLNGAVTRAAAVRIARESRYREIQAAQDDPRALDRFPEILGNPFIQQQKVRMAELQREATRLSGELGDLHPELIGVRADVADAEGRLREEVDKVVDSVRTEYEVARNEEEQLRSELDRRTQAALLLDRKGIEYGVLVREAESVRRIYDSLLQRADETSVTGELQASTIRIVDAAEVPLRPSRPRPLRTMLFGVFGATFLAFGLISFVEHLDDRLKTPDDIKTGLGQPYLGMVPKVDSKDDEDLLQVGPAVPDNFAAAVRTIRTSLFFSSAEEGCRSVAITSAEPGDGKSVLASNLAYAIAQSGQFTLLIDADNRRATQHRCWKQDQAPGLTDIMAGQAEPAAAIREIEPRLSVLPAGTRSPNVTELIASQRFQSFLAAQHERYDWIVLDTPPVLPIPDASIVAHAVNHVLFVADAQSTHRRSAAAALERLAADGARVVGVVLNKVNLDAHPYYYSQYYRRQYSRYYARA